MNLFNLFFSIVSLSLVQVGPALGAKSTATSFCKCICFNNSTIIALNPPPSSTSASAIHNLDIRSPRPLAAGGESDSNHESGKEKEPAAPSRPHHQLTCADCTRAFCLDYNLPICKNARDEDVFTTCFQRDSLKDETVVVIFIFATAGLLAWAIVKPWIDRLREKNTFTPLLQHDRSDRQRYTSNARARNAQRNPKSRSGNGNGNGNGMESRRGGGQTSANVPYDEDTHADQDAMDIVSGMPSGSGSRP
ncbi:uncharacterized protein Z519_07630 [Cladophialophora bantiana CBS 173.52]|uniref:Uncharacterized protein n=1 Tax=Cladophialophora bantiana (strain ATCC 10958 / CBS 173.52 / CDC B-1940 / NIH 8579) TaxID=1442370 RepID=A0A0D2FYX9_CLAB1|nr:uncharacterized protein Z519_07630 [Cladophialophora bantiana CBS 173.52]KIW91662.1 hypothetical protein Z519_07630 [Cladophialophora bantiana CBS 173.52]